MTEFPLHLQHMARWHYSGGIEVIMSRKNRLGMGVLTYALRFDRQPSLSVEWKRRRDNARATPLKNTTILTS